MVGGAQAEWMFGREAVLELTHNWGSEDDPNFKAHSGNEEPKGFGHIGFAVPDVEAACKVRQCCFRSCMPVLLQSCRKESDFPPCRFSGACTEPILPANHAHVLCTIITIKSDF